MYTIHSASQSHPGLKRARNEDFLVIHEPEDPDELKTSGRLYIVTDGVGGAAQGDLASQYAAEKVLREYYRSSQLHPGTRLRQAMRQVGNEIYHYAAENLGPVHMATTMVAATIWEDSLTIANVGDSRAYLIRNGSAQQLTRDHNLASELVRDGVITEEEAQNSPVKSRITRSLGGELDVFVDVFPDIPLRPGDRLLLCSDGLTRYARPDDLVPLATEGALEDAVKRMVEFANEAGGIDNTTVILIEVGEAIPEDSSAVIGARTDPNQPRPPRMDQDATLPGITLAALSQQDTVKSATLARESEELPPFDGDSLSIPASAETPAPKPSELADTLRTRPATLSTTPPATAQHKALRLSPSASPAASSARRSPTPGRRLQPHNPFGRYTPSLILGTGLDLADRYAGCGRLVYVLKITGWRGGSQCHPHRSSGWHPPGGERAAAPGDSSNRPRSHADPAAERDRAGLPYPVCRPDDNPGKQRPGAHILPDCRPAWREPVHHHHQAGHRAAI